MLILHKYIVPLFVHTLSIHKRQEDFRQINWVSEIEFPELTLQQIQDLLSISI